MKFFSKSMAKVWLAVLFCSSTLTAQFFNEGFEAAGTPAGWTIINNGTGNNWAHSTANGNAAPGCMQYTFTSASAADTWLFTTGVSLAAGQSIDWSFYEKVQSASYPENLAFSVGTAATVAGQTISLWSGTNLTNELHAKQSGTWVVPATGTYYFAFNCFSAADQWLLQVDDLFVEETPSCPNPSNLVVSNLTQTSADIIWTQGGGCVNAG